MSCGCLYKLQSLILTLGLTAGIILLLSISTNYWLSTSEPYDILSDSNSLLTPDPNRNRSKSKQVSKRLSSSHYSIIMLNTSSGLWKYCLEWEYHKSESPSVEEEESSQSCCRIPQYWRTFEGLKGAETSLAIIRSMRRSVPVLILSACCLLLAELISLFGYHSRDWKTLTGAVLFVISALTLVLGQILYISAVNDEVSQWKRPEGSTDDQKFTYRYGSSFYAAGSAFVLAMIAAVGQLTHYINKLSTGHGLLEKRPPSTLITLNEHEIGEITHAQAASRSDTGTARIQALYSEPVLEVKPAQQTPRLDDGRNAGGTRGLNRLRSLDEDTAIHVKDATSGERPVTAHNNLLTVDVESSKTSNNHHTEEMFRKSAI